MFCWGLLQAGRTKAVTLLCSKRSDGRFLLAAVSLQFKCQESAAELVRSLMMSVIMLSVHTNFLCRASHPPLLVFDCVDMAVLRWWITGAEASVKFICRDRLLPVAMCRSDSVASHMCFWSCLADVAHQTTSFGARIEQMALF